MFGGNTDASKELPMQGIEPNHSCPHCVNPHDLPHAKWELPRLSVFLELCAFGVGALLVSLLTFFPTVISPEAIVLKVICLVGGLGLCVGASFLLVRDLMVVWEWLNGEVYKFSVVDGVEHLHKYGVRRRSFITKDGSLALLIGRQMCSTPPGIIRGIQEECWQIGRVLPDGRVELYRTETPHALFQLLPKEALQLVSSCQSLEQVLGGKGSEAEKLERRVKDESLDLLDGAHLETVLWYLSDLLWVVGQPGPNEHWKKRVQAIREQFWHLACWMFDENEVRAQIRESKRLRNEDHKSHGDDFDSCPNCSTGKNVVYMARVTRPNMLVHGSKKPVYECIYCKHTTRPPKSDKKAGPEPWVPRLGLFGG